MDDAFDDAMTARDRDRLDALTAVDRGAFLDWLNRRRLTLCHRCRWPIEPEAQCPVCW